MPNRFTQSDDGLLEFTRNRVPYEWNFVDPVSCAAWVVLKPCRGKHTADDVDTAVHELRHEQTRWKSTLLEVKWCDPVTLEEFRAMTLNTQQRLNALAYLDQDCFASYAEGIMGHLEPLRPPPYAPEQWVPFLLIETLDRLKKATLERDLRLSVEYVRLLKLEEQAKSLAELFGLTYTGTASIKELVDKVKNLQSGA